MKVDYSAVLTVLHSADSTDHSTADQKAASLVHSGVVPWAALMAGMMVANSAGHSDSWAVPSAGTMASTMAASTAGSMVAQLVDKWAVTMAGPTVCWAASLVAPMAGSTVARLGIQWDDP